MLGHMKIVARLMVGFGLLVLLIAGLSSYGVYSGKATAQAFGRALRLSNNEMLIQRIEKEIFQGRMLIWVGLATGDGSKAQGAKDAFKLAREDLGTLRADTVGIHGDQPGAAAVALRIRAALAAAGLRVQPL